MSQFDFPRINFEGNALINPGTANNNLLLPLITYDPVSVKAILPPRLYLNSDILLLYALDGLPMDGKEPVLVDEFEASYFEIASVNTVKKYKEWIKKPLGSCHLDAKYHELYKIVNTKRTNSPLFGCTPASWNYYGGMEFSFNKVKVNSIVLSNDLLFCQETKYVPSDMSTILGAEINMNNEKGNNMAVMIDVIPSLALYSQVFCDSLQMIKDQKVLFKGKPKKGSLRFLNTERVVNQEGVLGSSGTFFLVIPIDDFQEKEIIFSLFRKYARNYENIKGIAIRYNLYDVVENQTINYEEWGEKGNPASVSLLGTISPWYEGEMNSISMGRLLLSEKPIINNKKLGQIVGSLHENAFSLDFISSIPFEKNLELNKVEVPNYGKLIVKLKMEETESVLEIGAFILSPENYNFEKLKKGGGLIDFEIPKGISADQIEKGTLQIYGVPFSDTTEVLLSNESPYMIASDQVGMYAEQGQLENTYRSYVEEKEPCQIRVFKKGKPLENGIAMQIIELKIEGLGSSSSVTTYLKTQNFKDKKILKFSTLYAANLMYVFYPEPCKQISNDIVSEIKRTGFFLNLRVLPKKDLSHFIDVGNGKSPDIVTFEIVYEEILKEFDLIFPIASVITPFEENYFEKGAKYIYQRLSPSNWDSASYMPSSRDMHLDKWNLFCKWFEKNKGG